MKGAGDLKGLGPCGVSVKLDCVSLQREFVTCLSESDGVTSIPHSPPPLLARVRRGAGAYESRFCVPNFCLELSKELR